MQPSKYKTARHRPVLKKLLLIFYFVYMYCCTKLAVFVCWQFIAWSVHFIQTSPTFISYRHSNSTPLYFTLDRISCDVVVTLGLMWFMILCHLFVFVNWCFQQQTVLLLSAYDLQMAGGIKKSFSFVSMLFVASCFLLIVLFM